MNARGWKAIIFGILGGTAVLNVIVFVAAQRSKVPLLEDRPYERSLQFDDRYDASKRLLDLGWSLVPSLVKDSGSGTFQFRLEIRDRDGQGVTQVQPQVELLRMSGDQADQRLTLAPTAEAGVYQATVPDHRLKSGTWYAESSMETPTGPVWTRQAFISPE